jgi:hypothetical protein
MRETAQSRIVSISALLILLGTISGCAAGGSGQHSADAANGSASPTGSGSASPVSTGPATPEATFALPATCTDLTGADLEASFLADGNSLFTDPDGSGQRDGVVFASTQESGTPFSCWYLGASIETAFEVAVQGLTQDAHEATLAALRGGGFVESTDGAVYTFTQVGNFVAVGDTANTEAIVHVVRAESWITIAFLKGGAEQIARINEWLPIVTAQVYG